MTTLTPLRRIVAGASFALSCLMARAHAGDVEIQIRDQDGVSVPGTVVAMYPSQPSAIAAKPLATAIVDQRHLTFVPHVLAIQAGTPVEFPNSDQVRHHVYSFSPAKKFELRLYKGTPAAPVVFDQPGLVTLGCNIHDWMVAYVDVVATPYFGQADEAGHIALAALPSGTYRLEVWHPRLGDLSKSFSEKVEIDAGPTHHDVRLALGPPEPAPPVPTELEQKFRRYQSQEP